jgi:protein-tyrosine phosphatase
VRTRWTIYLTVVILAFAMLPACQQGGGGDTDSATTTAKHSRQVMLDGQANFRDIGGYKTSDGRVVKWGQVYRSGELHKLSDSDLKVLEDLGVQKVASFLTNAEIEARGNDRLPEGVAKIHLPIESGNAAEMTELVGEARRTGDFSLLPPDVNPAIHRMLVQDGREEYAAILREISDPGNRPYVYHCSHGIHRTGTATAILLAILGVPWETVREDYLLSNEYRSEEIERRLEELRHAAAKTLGIPSSEVDMTNARAFYILQDSYIDATWDEIIKNYGTIDNYAREGLGLSEAEIQRLRLELLD